jgi:Transglycosylase SLT domain
VTSVCAALAKGLWVPLAVFLSCVAPSSQAPQPPQPSFQPPAGAVRWKKVIVNEWRFQFGIASNIAVPFAQIHQESGYNPNAVSPVGASGLAQFMPATAAGLERNVTRLQELCDPKRNPKGCPLEERWAIRALTILDHDEYMARPIKSEEDRLAMMLSAYNGGSGWTERERRECRASSWQCNGDLWFGNVEKVCVRNPSACRENREYPFVILRKWLPKYTQWLLP